MPKLIGIITLQLAYVKRTESPAFGEKISHVAFDTDGNAWGLVQRYTPMGDATTVEGILAGVKMGRLDYKRWIRFEAIPFELEERISSEGWGNL